MKEIHVIKHTHKNDFEQEVNKYLRDGWDLHGNTSVVIWSSTLVYNQVMVRKVEYQRECMPG